MAKKIIVLIDTSGSMVGEPSRIAETMANNLIVSLQNNSVTNADTDIGLIAYNLNVTELLPMTQLDRAIIPSFAGLGCGPKNLGCALKYVNARWSKLSLLIIITKGKPSDPLEYNTQIRKTQSMADNIYVLHGNMQKSEDYKTLTSHIIPWENVDATSLIKKVYGGTEIFSSDGRCTLPEPPKSITISI